jgi:hypothetical protein
MKKILVFILFFPILVSAQFDAKYEAHKFIKTKPPMTKYFKMILHFYKEHGIDIDYSKIREIKFEEVMFDEEGFPLAGHYGEDKVIRIKVSHPLAVTYGLYDEVVLATLAHEIGHSQGLLHDTLNIDNLMYPRNSAMYNALISKSRPLSEILLSPYKNK